MTNIGFLVSAIAMAAAAQLEGGTVKQITLVPQTEVKSISAACTAPWVAPGDTSWYADKPAGHVQDSAGRMQADAWLAVTAENLLIHAVVHDKIQVNAPDEFALWKPDGIEIGVDMRGNATGVIPAETPGLLGPDDAKFMAALTPKGAAASRDTRRRNGCSAAGRREGAGQGVNDNAGGVNG